jgi:transcriptional regulator with GAF, ATPase, and Fis domain
MAVELAADNIPFVYLSANSNEDVLNAAKHTQPYGFLVKPFREKDLLVAMEIARYRHAHQIEARYHKETALRKELKKIINDNGTWQQKLLKVVMALQRIIPFDFFAAGLENAFLQSFLRIGFDEYQVIGLTELSTITGKSAAELTGQQLPSLPVYYDDASYLGPGFRKLFADHFQLKSGLEIPLRLSDGKACSICLFSRRPGAYTGEQLELFESIQVSLIQTIEKLLQENTGDTQVSITHTKIDQEVDGIIGKSHLLLNVFDQLAQVAPSDTSVLILGESGTGKEKIASSIHRLSSRKARPFIKLNCAALPSSLIESDLFGHEKGAFTGAHERRLGIFERADKGTLFLDEVGDMPVELQVKLLRVLQEKEIERVGGRETIKVNVRIIAATNKNLEKEVADGRFRLDLYYRLNVFLITLPALRERKEDIPALAYHFMNHFADKAGRKLSGISDNVLRKMMAYKWPGNIRELEHLIERSVLLTKGAVIEEIQLPTVEKKDRVADVEEAAMKTIAENERDYIIAVLKKCNGRIWGPGAAAEILNLNPSTLKSKMKKLGIKKEYIH